MKSTINYEIACQIRLDADKLSRKELAKKYNITMSNISNIILFKRWATNREKRVIIPPKNTIYEDFFLKIIQKTSDI